MKGVIGLVMMLGFGAVACGNACDEATDKLKDDCDMSSFAGIPIEESDDCSESDECAADCFNDASCSEIKAADANPTADNALIQCLAGCA